MEIHVKGAPHGHSVGPRGAGVRSPTYNSWRGMMDRCYCPSTEAFARYGGRGITVCQRWHVFAAFLEDMGERPEGMTLDRTDNNGGYSPDNCRWATNREQWLNRRTTRFLTFRGETKPLCDWARDLGVTGKLIGKRLNRGWSVERALGERCSADGN